MSNYLIDHAIKNVWCSPEQDNQFILKLARLTPSSGLIGSAQVLWSNINLPDSTSRWHVFQIGQLHPLLLGLFPKVRQWVSFSESCNQQNMLADVYTVKGVQLPRFQTYYMYNADQDLIVAVRKNSKIGYDFANDDVYLRVYSDAYFNTTQASADGYANQIYVQGAQTTTTADVLALQTAYNTYAAKPGAVTAYVNGLRVKAIDLVNMTAGDVGEFVYDSTVYKVIEFQVSTLGTFNSTLDSKIKYLLHYAGGDAGRIDFQDDIDVYVVQKLSATKEIGLYYHKNNADAMRMVTHRDYSIVPSYVVQYNNALQSITGTTIDVRSLYIRLYIKKSGYNRPLIYEANRIFELYKLSDTQILQAMLGVDSTVSIWSAQALEASAYCKLMRSKYTEVTPSLVEQAYGYNGCAKVLGDMPLIPYTNSSQLQVSVPPVMQLHSLAYEYDTNGKMLGRYLNNNQAIYSCFNNNCGLVEFFCGGLGIGYDESYGFTNVAVDSTLDYRVYMCHIVNGTQDNKWVDITGDATRYKIANGVASWISVDPSEYPMIRSDRTNVAYDLDLPMSSGLYKFTLTSEVTRNGSTFNQAMQIPPGSLDVFVQKRLLTPGLDYFINFPVVVITNKEYLLGADGSNQPIHVRMMGHCTKDLKIRADADVGFVANGTLSANNAFDLRDDRVLQLFLDGYLRSLSTVKFAEDGVSASINDVLNGRPYQVREVVVPMRGMTPTDTYTLYEQALDIDYEVSKYLTIKLPETDPTTPSAIRARYQVVSPFIASILNDLKNGNLVPPVVNGAFGRMKVSTLCKSYEYLLAFDPTQTANQPNTDYVIYHPNYSWNVTTLNANAYKFLLEVVKYYCSDLVSLSSFVNIS
jgi:hypothetical protein